MVDLVQGIEMELDPHECVDAALLFYPQLYDRREIAFLRSTLKTGDIFVDVGAHLGFYSFVAAQQVGPTGRILAIEADPVTFGKLSQHIERNRTCHIAPINQGVSDKTEILPFWLNSSGNRGGNTFLPRESIGRCAVQVECRPLHHLLNDFHVPRVDGMKLDIEGFEYRVLRRFLREASRDMYPGFIIIEHNPAWVGEAGGNAVDLLKSAGYRVQVRTKYNFIMLRH
jgi:FkbM family methyltransferase